MQFSEKALRVKYMRLLEKYLKSCENILKLENFDYLLFEKNITKRYLQIQDLKELKLNSSYLNSLKSFSDLVMSVIRDEKMSIQEKKKVLLREVNQICKQKNTKRYKRGKHKIEDYDS